MYLAVCVLTLGRIASALEEVEEEMLRSLIDVQVSSVDAGTDADVASSDRSASKRLHQTGSLDSVIAELHLFDADAVARKRGVLK